MNPTRCQCGKSFTRNHRAPRHYYCSRACKQWAYRRRKPQKPGSRPKLTPSRKVQLVSLAKSGIKPLAIALEMKINPATVYRHMQAHNIKWSP